MNKKYAMSTLGYAIVLVIILGLVMIISAPMLIDKYNNKEIPKTVEEYNSTQDVLYDLETRLTARIEELEKRQNSSVSNKYICTIDGNLDENGNIVPKESSFATEKFVFVCEYKR